MSNIIVTGATSFIGAPLVKKLINMGNRVYAVVRPNSKKLNALIQSENLVIVECDLINILQLDEMISEKCDTFFHIAWNGTRVPERDDFELQNKNYENCLEAYDVSKKIGCKTFISTGSQAEYGSCVGDIDETYPTNPVTEYGKAKLKAYETIKSMASLDGMKFGWIRIFSSYGPSDYSNSLISMCIKKMLKNEDIELTSGEQNWNYVYVEDVVNILIELMINDNYSNDVFNVCSNDTRPLKEYVIELKNILASDSKLLFGKKQYNKSEGIVSFSPINEKTKRILGYDEYSSFKDGIFKIIKD